ncbi:MAG: nucleotidyl transferase AbiEii/AbiGii toxin family protein [Bacteroidales bacterium]
MLFKETIEEGTLELLKSLQQTKMCEEFHLAGGTALALQIGHRTSVDIDFFSQYNFNIQELLEYLEQTYSFHLYYSAPNTLKGMIHGVMVDFIAHKYPLAGKILEKEGISMYPVEDIAAMKLNAIAGDGTRAKDFIDMYFLLKIYSISEILDFYAAKYSKRNVFHAFKSLMYFEDIDASDWPNMVQEKDLTLSKVKALITEKANSINIQ